VKYFAWDDAKNPKLRKERGIGFEDVVFHIGRRSAGPAVAIAVAIGQFPQRI